MTYSYTEKKRIRKDFGEHKNILEVPHLVATQIESFNLFLQAGTHVEDRMDVGLESAFRSVFPIESVSRDIVLEYVSYHLAVPVFDVKECQLRGLTYAAVLKVKEWSLIYIYYIFLDKSRETII